MPNYEAWQPQICAVFGKEGHVWLADRASGLLYSTDGGLNFTKITSVSEATRVTVGKAAPSASYPAIFIWGVVNSVNGLFRSDDQGATWQRINDAEHEYARNHSVIAGDPRVYGRLYDGIGGRGVVYGDIASVACASLSLPSTASLCETGSANIDTKITDAAYTFAWKKDGTTLAVTTSSIAVSDTGSYTVVAKKTSCTDLTATVKVPACQQSISLSAGWNLLSFNVHPKDSSIATLFAGLNLQELKTMDAFWRLGQDAALNGITKLTAGNGYLVNMNTAGTLTLSGMPCKVATSYTAATTWQLLGCTYKTATPFTSIFDATNCSAIKNFDGFWMPNNNTSSILNIEPGKGYFIK